MPTRHAPSGSDSIRIQLTMLLALLLATLHAVYQGHDG